MSAKSVETITLEADKRKSIPTAELHSVVKEEQQHSVRAGADAWISA